TTIGTGTAAPSPSRVNAGHLVEAEEVRLLLDCGSGVAHRLASIGADWMGITHVALTHFHADHVLDLPTLLVAWRYGALPPRTAPLEIIGPPGTTRLVEMFGAAFGDPVARPEFPVTVREIASNGSIDLADSVRLEARPVPHTPESIAYCVRGGGQRLVYTGDTGYDEALAVWEATHRCDVLLAECSLPDDMAIATHLTPTRCALLAAAAEPARLVLTHFYPPVEDVDIRAVIATRYSGPVVLASDGWSIDIEDI
ncbi:MAG TPA: ribonuclease Z, partial [Ramlibacter sp.]|nr:ribonuclease Z [Ramlibacter sp.]